MRKPVKATYRSGTYLTKEKKKVTPPPKKRTNRKMQKQVKAAIKAHEKKVYGKHIGISDIQMKRLRKKWKKEEKEEKPQSAGRRGSISAKESIRRATRVNRSSNKRR